MATNNVTVYQFEVGFSVSVSVSSGQGKSMQFVDPDRIEQSDHVQAASFAPSKWSFCPLATGFEVICYLQRGVNNHFLNFFRLFSTLLQEACIGFS